MGTLVETLRNTAHLHLLLNHVPTVGYDVALALLLAGWRVKSADLTRASLALFFVVAVVSIATYVTGNAAEILLGGGDAKQLLFAADVDAQAIRAHEDAALWALALIELTGFVAWLALWHWRRAARLAGGYLGVLLVLAVMTFAAAARTAELGGAIHHPEIRASGAGVTPDVAPVGAGGAGWVRRFGTDFVDGHAWVWPTLETLHFVGLCMLFTVVLVVDLRLLGMMKSVPYAAFDQLLPIGILGFGINLITGVMFFIGQTAQYVQNVMFFWKVVFIVLGGLNVLYFLLAEDVWRLGAGDDASIVSKVAAGSAIVLWAAVLFGGHMLPFIGNSF